MTYARLSQLSDRWHGDEDRNGFACDQQEPPPRIRCIICEQPVDRKQFRDLLQDGVIQFGRLYWHQACMEMEQVAAEVDAVMAIYHEVLRETS